jgi:FkbM family methyltransferase
MTPAKAFTLPGRVAGVVVSRLRERLAPVPKLRTVAGVSLTLHDGIDLGASDYDSAWAFSLMQSATTFFDVGANRGETALLALIAGVEHLVVIDADADALASCTRNIAANFPGRLVRFVRCFVGDSDEGTRAFYAVRGGAANSMYAQHAVTAARIGQRLQVANRRLDTLCEQSGLVPDLVKIDIEGAERLALRGASKLAARGKTRFLVEMHSNPELTMQDNAAAVLTWAGDSSYEVFYLKHHQRLTSPEPIAGRGRCHLLLQPQGWDYPAQLHGIAQGAPLPKGRPHAAA